MHKERNRKASEKSQSIFGDPGHCALRSTLPIRALDIDIELHAHSHARITFTRAASIHPTLTQSLVSPVASAPLFLLFPFSLFCDEDDEPDNDDKSAIARGPVRPFPFLSLEELSEDPD